MPGKRSKGLWLEKTNIANVGDPIASLLGSDSFITKSICLGFSHAFGVGNSKFRTSQKAEYVDTVAFGAWPKSIFEEVGLFDELFTRSDDIEFKARIHKSGGRIYLTPEIQSYYHRRDTLKGLWKQNYANGKEVIYTKVVAPYALSWRHFIPFVFVSSLIVSASLSLILFCMTLFSVSDISPFSFGILSGNSLIPLAVILGCYAFANIFSSAMLAYKHGFRYFFVRPVVFATLHFSYGLGSIRGLLTLKKWIVKNVLTTKARRH